MLSSQQIATLLDLPGIGKKSVQKILSKIEPQYNISNPNELYELLELLNKRQSVGKDEFYNIFNRNIELFERYSDLNIEAININQERYPVLLKIIDDAPVIIYVKGQIEAVVEQPTIAVIGTREPTEYGKRIGTRIAEILAENNITVVSGLAKGCDTVAHKGTLNKNGKTVSVLAHGLHKIYPKENERLAEQMIEMGGCLITEYALGVEPFKNYFVERDRIQSGLSYATVVIETAIKGGTMHTVDYTLKQGRLLYVIEHPIDKRTEKSGGNFDLLRKGKAKGLIKPEDINDLIGEINKRFEKKQIKIEEEQSASGDRELETNKEETKINKTNDAIVERLTLYELAEKFNLKVKTIQKHIDDNTFTKWMKKKDKARSWYYDEEAKMIFTKDGDLFIN